MGGRPPGQDSVDRTLAEWATIRPEVDVTALGVTQRIVRTAQLITRRLDEAAQRNGLRVRGDYNTLTTLRRAHPVQLTPAGLAEIMLVTASGMTGRLDRLEGAGLLVREHAVDDRRSVLVGLTEQGLSVVDRTFASVVADQNEVVANLSARQIEQLSALLRHVSLSLGDR